MKILIPYIDYFKILYKEIVFKNFLKLHRKCSTLNKEDSTFSFLKLNDFFLLFFLLST